MVEAHVPRLPEPKRHLKAIKKPVKTLQNAGFQLLFAPNPLPKLSPKLLELSSPLRGVQVQELRELQGLGRRREPRGALVRRVLRLLRKAVRGRLAAQQLAEQQLRGLGAEELLPAQLPGLQALQAIELAALL